MPFSFGVSWHCFEFRKVNRTTFDVSFVFEREVVWYEFFVLNGAEVEDCQWVNKDIALGDHKCEIRSL